jgi:hypothetical protein
MPAMRMLHCNRCAAGPIFVVRQTYWRDEKGVWIMGIFSGLINSRQRAADRRYADHLAFLQGMSPRDRADISLKMSQIETVARQMAKR